MFEEDEIPKYKKRSHKTQKKSTHKHQYVPCLLKSEYPFCKEWLDKGEYCIICGKIGAVKSFLASMTEEEKAKYEDPSIPTFLYKFGQKEIIDFNKNL